MPIAIPRLPILAVLLSLAACASPSAPSVTINGKNASAPAPVANTKITAFAVSNENLSVDKVGLRDGLFKPDGARDLAFTATVDGPFEAIFIVSCNAKGEPGYGLRADTLIGNEEIPRELGGVIDTGKMTFGVGVVEGGKFINGDNGSAHGAGGIHNLTLYTPNSSTLAPGSFVRMYIRLPGGGGLVPGPVAPY